MSKKASDVWAQIEKYSTIANATALTISLSSVGKSSVFDFAGSIGKAPIWFFFFGLLAGGSRLVVNFFYLLKEEADELKRRVSSLEEKESNARAKALKTGEFPEERTSSTVELAQIRAAMDLPIYRAPENLADQLRTIQEALLWCSYALFFLGLFFIVWSV